MKPLSQSLCYPLYLIANNKGVLVANTGGKDCVMLFHSKKLARRHIAQAKVAGELYPLAIPSAAAFREGLDSLPPDITCAIWDATVVPCSFVYMELNELFLALEDG